MTPTVNEMDRAANGRNRTTSPRYLLTLDGDGQPTIEATFRTGSGRRVVRGHLVDDGDRVVIRPTRRGPDYADTLSAVLAELDTGLLVAPRPPGRPPDRGVEAAAALIAEGMTRGVACRTVAEAEEPPLPDTATPTQRLRRRDRVSVRTGRLRDALRARGIGTVTFGVTSSGDTESPTG